MTQTIDPIDLVRDLTHFTGTEEWYFSPLYKWMKYTDGVKFFAEKAGAYWFLDIIGTELRELAKEEFIAVSLVVTGSTAVILATNGNDEVSLWKKDIEFTDCPVGEWKFYLVGNVLLLPNEY